MLNNNLDTRHLKWLHTMEWILTAILYVKIMSYFTWSENIIITRIVKVICRILMTGIIVYTFQKIVAKGAIGRTGWRNTLSPFMYVAYLALGFISFFWSTDVGYSSLQWFMDIESLVFAFFFIKSIVVLGQYFPQHPIKLYNMLGIAIFFTVIIFDIGMYVNPDSFYRLTHGGEEARLGGYIINPNELGMLCALGISCSIFMWRYEKNKGWTIVRTLLMLWAMLMTGSRSSLVGCFLIIFFHIRQAENKKLQILMYLGAAAAVPVGVAKIFLKQGGLDEVLSMTGRLPFWTALLTEGLPKEPLFGFGFMRIAYTDLFESVHTYAGHMTHNTFIQVLMNLGIVGFIIVLIQMIFTFKAFLKEEEINKLMMIGIIIPVLINSFTEFGIFGETNFSILFYQLLIFSVSINPIKILTRSEKILLKRTRPELQTA